MSCAGGEDVDGPYTRPILRPEGKVSTTSSGTSGREMAVRAVKRMELFDRLCRFVDHTSRARSIDDG